MNKSTSILKGNINKQDEIYPRHKDFRIRKELSGPRVLPPSSSATCPTWMPLSLALVNLWLLEGLFGNFHLFLGGSSFP